MVSATNFSRLTKRQERFCHEYIVDMNGQEAAIRAGYKAANAKVIASTLLAKPEIRFNIAKLQRLALQRIDLTADRVLYELASVAFSNMANYMQIGPDGLPELDLSKLSKEQWAAITEFTEDSTGGQNDGERRLIVRHRIKLGSKIQALDLLAQHFKLLTQKHEHTMAEDLVAKLREGRERVRVLEHKPQKQLEEAG